MSPELPEKTSAPEKRPESAIIIHPYGNNILFQTVY